MRRDDAREYPIDVDALDMDKPLWPQLREQYNRWEDQSQERGLLAKMTKNIVDQEDWIHDHGATLAGYIFRYGTEFDPKDGTSGGPAIYQSDVLYLQLLVTQRNNVIKAMRNIIKTTRAQR